MRLESWFSGCGGRYREFAEFARALYCDPFFSRAGLPLTTRPPRRRRCSRAASTRSSGEHIIGSAHDTATTRFTTTMCADSAPAGTASPPPAGIHAVSIPTGSNHHLSEPLVRPARCSVKSFNAKIARVMRLTSLPSVRTSSESWMASCLRPQKHDGPPAVNRWLDLRLAATAHRPRGSGYLRFGRTRRLRKKRQPFPPASHW
jgi:hypothetical protein